MSSLTSLIPWWLSSSGSSCSAKLRSMMKRPRCPSCRRTTAARRVPADSCSSPSKHTLGIVGSAVMTWSGRSTECPGANTARRLWSDLTRPGGEGWWFNGEPDRPTIDRDGNDSGRRRGRIGRRRRRPIAAARRGRPSSRRAGRAVVGRWTCWRRSMPPRRRWPRPSTCRCWCRRRRRVADRCRRRRRHLGRRTVAGPPVAVAASLAGCGDGRADPHRRRRPPTRR